MTLQTQTLSPGGSSAERAAADCWSANCAALRATQPRLLTDAVLPNQFAWTFGRDGALTARHHGGAWWAGCSLPRGAAHSILKTLDAGGRVACFLAPTTAAQVRVALDKLRPDQAIIVLCSSMESLCLMLHCEDFSADIAAHRLWFACGEQWSDELNRLFEENPGLPTPAQFIRGAAADHGETDAMIPVAEKIFSVQNARRAQVNEPIRTSWKPSDRKQPRICLLAPSHFRLWDDGGHVLARTLADSHGQECEVVLFDSDDPATASSAALAKAACECDAAVAMNLAREDLPDVLPDGMPWITWLVRERIPASAAAGKRDALIVADGRARSSAIAKGWNAQRVEVAAWPLEKAAPDRPCGERYLSLIADTVSLEAPPRIVDLSSQNLLWDAIAAEVVSDPFVATPEADAYLRRRQRDLRIPDGELDRELYVGRLLTAAFQQGIVRLLVREKLPIRVWGDGWANIEEFADIAGGAVRSREQLSELTQSSAAVIYAWPVPRAQAIDAIGRPILRPATGRTAFLASARKALAGQYNSQVSGDARLTASRIIALVNHMRSDGD